MMAVDDDFLRGVESVHSLEELRQRQELRAVDPADREGRKSVQRFFQVDVELPQSARSTARVGGRAYVRFDHGWEPLGMQWYRRARQLFLARFNV